jgi:glycosyltransferase involved in cell wall biosynthesis
VLPTINGSRFIAESITSILTQTYRHLELIVVDGGSTDGTLEIVARLTDPRLKVLRQGSNIDKLPGALNAGFAVATGTYFTWAQDDDLYGPEALAVMVRALNDNPDVGLVYAGFHFVDESCRFVRAATLGPPEGLTRSNVVGHCFLYRRTVAEQAGPYDPAFLMSEDTHFWLRVYQRSRLLYLPGCYYFHRLHGGSLTIRDYGQYRALRVSARARRQVLRISWWAYTRQVSAAYIEEAFAAYAQRDLQRVRRCLLHGLLRNPTWLRNRGVWSLGVRSVLGVKSARWLRRTRRF